MRFLAVHTCPMWEDLATGKRVVVLEPAAVPEPGRLVGWVNALVIRIGGHERVLLSTGAS